MTIDEANLLGELRRRLGITIREHRVLEAKMGRFPKKKCELHSHDEIDKAKYQLQREAILWTFRGDNGDIDAIPREIMDVIRSEVKKTELQAVNYERLLNNGEWSNNDFRDILRSNGFNTRGTKAQLIENIMSSRMTPSEILSCVNLTKLQDVCKQVGIPSSGTKDEVISRLINFYDNLTFQPVKSQDLREKWYQVYELLAARKYSELRAQGLIDKQEQVDSAFEEATNYIFEKLLKLDIQKALPVKSADGKIYLQEGKKVILWDCKSDERDVNLQDHLENQFDGYMREEQRNGRDVLCFLVIAPRFTSGSLNTALRYKMQTNWDVSLLTASGLIRLAERWHAAKPDQQFPINLLNMTGLIDENRAEQLLSLEI